MAYDAYIKLEGIDGEATAEGQKGAIELYSFSWGASNPTTVGSGSTGLTAGKVSVSSFNFMKKTDLASGPLFLRCCTGKHIPTATVTLRKASGDEKAPLDYLVYKFSNVMVESVQWSGASGGDDTPTESVSLAFAKVEITYSQQATEKGTQAKTSGASWDITTVAGGAKK